MTTLKGRELNSTYSAWDSSTLSKEQNNEPIRNVENLTFHYKMKWLATQNLQKLLY